MNSIFSPIFSLIGILTYSPFWLLDQVASPIFKLLQKLLRPLAVKLQSKTESSRFGIMIQKWTGDGDILAHLATEARRLSRSSMVTHGERLLIEGRRREFAELVAPPEKYPPLYKDVPADLRRSIIADGRLVNGEAPATALAGQALTPEFVKKAWAHAVGYGAKTAFIVFVVCIAASLYIVMPKFSGTAKAPQETQQVMPEANADMGYLASRYEDIWSQKQANEVSKKVNIVDNTSKYAAAATAMASMTIQSIVMLLMLVVASLAFTFASGRIAFLLMFRYRVFEAVDQSVAGLRHSWREALQRWRFRLDEREMEQANFADQVHFATEIDRSPLLDIGKALGVMEFRGHLLAPLQHTQVQMSVADLLMHVAVLGSSGEGKSRDFYMPMARQLLNLRKQGYPIAIYATDDKGAIGVDILDACRDIGIPDEDIIVIGTGPTDWRIDLLDGLSPVQMTEIMSSIAKQSGGDSDKSFWPEMASDLILQIATVLETYEQTAAGIEWVKKNEMRAYSLLNILRVASNNEEIEMVMQVVTDALRNKDDQYRRIAHLDKNSLRAATEYLAFTWLPMVDVTAMGIYANVRAVLRGFAFKDAIASGFADGAGERLLSIQEISSNKIKIINVSQIEHGMAGRMVAIMLKTLLFKQARDAEQQDPAFAKERLQWWFNPKPGPDSDKYTINVFLADEYQSLLTSSGSDGLSDGLVWNVLRSAGVAGVLLSQSWSAYRLAVGEDALNNIRNNWRTKIFLRSEDIPTIDEAKRLAGKVTRYQSMDWNHYEGTVAVRRETGADVEFNTSKIVWNDDENGQSSGSFGSFASWGSKFDFHGYNNLYNQDTRFILRLRQQFGDSGNGDAVVGSMQASAWRQQDREVGILQHGSSQEDAVRDAELMEMGRGRALVFIQRAGGTRVDFIKLNSK